jgi:hypothetical protein
MKWNDWFDELPINELLPRDGEYGLLITLRHIHPWTHNHEFRQKMITEFMEIDRTPVFRVSFGDLIKYLAQDCAHTMAMHEAIHNMEAWLSLHCGVVLNRVTIAWWTQVDTFLDPNDYKVLREAASKI